MNLEPHEKRKDLTRFICQELLYEFVLGKLDTERQKAMDEYLTTCRDSQHELERLRRGFVFSSQMAKTEVSPELHQALMGFEPVWMRRLAAWTAWWSRRGWKLLPYFVITGIIVLGLAVAKPWQLFTQRDVVLVETAKQEATTASPPADSKVQNNTVTPLKPDAAKEAAVAAKAIVPPVIPAVIPAVKPKAAEKPKIAEEEAEASAVTPIPSPMMVPAPAPAVVPMAAENPEATADDTPALDAPAAKSEHKWLLRGKMEVKDFDVAAAAIREKITFLDGKVIGTVALGSQRKKGEAYFHFSLPESKQDEFETYLKNFGPVRFGKEADKRGMPEGENHIILTVKDGSPHE
ncbi:MAG: anti-sigma factor family protein, partial [Bdellovibrionales bacterium]